MAVVKDDWVDISETGGVPVAGQSQMDADDYNAHATQTNTNTTAIAALDDELDDKADAAATTSALSGKANTTTVNSQLAGKADSVHTHTSAQITDFVEAAQDAIATALAGTSGVTVSYNDAANTITISGLGDASATAENIRDAIGVALVGVGVVSVTANDALDTITISSTATANSPDATLLARGNHTGTQLPSTIAGLDEYVQDMIATFLQQGTGITLSYNDAGNQLTISASGGGGGSDTKFVGNLGTGSPGPYVFTHNLGSRNWHGFVRRNAGHPDNIGLDQSVAPGVAGEYIDCPLYPHPTNLNQAYAAPDDTWATNQFQVMLELIGGDDTTAPTGATLGTSNITTTGVRVTATGAADNVAVSMYEWDLAGVLQGRTLPGTAFWDYTGLTPSTTYTNQLGCTVVDLQGNRTRTTTSVTTAAPASAAFVKAADSKTDTNVSQQDVVITPDVVSNPGMVVGVVVSHLGGNWDNPDAYTTRTVVDVTDSNAAYTYLGGIGLGQGTQETGGVLLFGRIGGTMGTAHTIRANMVAQGNNQAIRVVAVQLSGVASFGTAVKQTASPSNRAGSIGPVTNAAGDLMIGVFGANADPTPNAGTERGTNGAAVGGVGDFISLVTAPGTGSGFTFTTSSTGHIIGGVAVNAVKA